VARGARLACLTVVLVGAAPLAGCGSSNTAGNASASAHNQTSNTNETSTTNAGISTARPQAIEPTAGQQAVAVAPAATQDPPVGDPNAHAPSLNEVKNELQMELVAVKKSNARYIDPLQYVTVWERTDQGVDAVMPLGAPILAPCKIKVLATIPDWYAGQPLVYFELLEGPDAGKLQYVAEQITDIAPVGILQRGQAVARFARIGTGIEYGWSTINGVTLARATTGYEEGQVTPAGVSIRNWLNNLGANAGPS
jgi:hypothetical protein